MKVSKGLNYSVVRDAAKKRVDDQAELERLKWIPTQGMAYVYQEKYAEATAYLANSAPDANAFPFLSAEAAANKSHPQTEAQKVMGARQRKSLMLAQIELLRRSLKMQIDSAPDREADINAIPARWLGANTFTDPPTG